MQTLLGLLVLVAVALVGASAGNRYEGQRWLRQQRLEAYAAYVAAVDAMERLASRWSVSWDKADEKEQIERYYDGLEGMSRAVGRIHLLGESKLVAACVRLQRHWDLEVQSALALHDSHRLLGDYPDANRLYNDVVRAARRELGRPEAPLSKSDFTALENDRAKAREEAERRAVSAGKSIDTLPHP